jgi:hypothetical protein
MSLTPSEANAAYGELSLIAIGAGLKWLVEDAAVEISLGKQSLQKIKTETTQYAEDDGYAPKRKGKPATFVITAEYTENEKLQLLVEALEAVSSGTTIALAQVFNCLSDSDTQNPRDLTFAPDGEQGRKFTLDRSILRRKEKAVHLQNLLLELKEAI